jgi:MoaA/NifB/PqqE/SkfB family radical SAM enzyme
MGIFLANLDALLSRGFPVFVSVVATPKVLVEMDEIGELIRSVGLTPVPKVLRGDFEGKRFPGAYTQSERERFRNLAQIARDNNRLFFDRATEAPSVNPFCDDQILDGEPTFLGKSCAAGHRFVSIGANGDVCRCSRDEVLGNVLRGTFRPKAEASPCDTGYCFYFCMKYSVSQ